MPARVAWISIAPVKGLALVRRDSVELEPEGVRENRRFYVLDAGGRMLNGKRLGPLVGVVPDYDEAAGRLALTFPAGETVAGAVETGERVVADFYGRPVEGRLVEGPWGRALSAFGGRSLRLVRVDAPGGGVDRGGQGTVSLVSEASLGALAAAAGMAAPVDGRRFRMLFGVSGVDAHEEDDWLGRDVQLGEASVRLHAHVGRCAVTTQNPDTGIRDLDTLAAIAAYRSEVETREPLPFGVWGEVARPGRVAVGDVVSCAGMAPIRARHGKIPGP